MQALWDFINSFVSILKNIGTWLLDGVLFLFTSIFSILLDIVFAIVILILNAAGSVVSVVDYGAAWAGLPTQLIYVLNQVGISTCLSMLGAAYLARFLLNLIPASVTRV